MHTIVTLKLARRSLEQGRPDAPGLVGDALRHAEAANDELRELAHGAIRVVLEDVMRSSGSAGEKAAPNAKAIATATTPVIW